MAFRKLIKKIDKAFVKKTVLFFTALVLFLITFPFVWRFAVEQYYERKIYAIDAAPATDVAIVFGAGIDQNGRLSAVLQDRMDVAIALYEAGTVQKLLLSGDNRFENYDEPGAMRLYALARGVAAEDMQPDYGGRRTYDTCYRAKHIFQVESAILVTQRFHLPRALLNCNQLGVEAIGVSSNLQSYALGKWFAFREVPATLQSTWDVVRKNPAPVMGESIPLIN